MLRLIGWVFGLTLCIGALYGASREAASLFAGGYRPYPLGQLWFDLDPSSLNLVQAVVQRYIHPALWDPAIQTLLTWPAWLVLGLPGLLILWGVARRRQRRRRGWR